MAVQSQHRFGPVIEALFGAFKKVKFYRLLGLRSGLGKKVIDIGCGRGDLLSFAQRRDWQTLGFEFDTSSARKAAVDSRLNVMVAEELPQQMALQAGRADLITMLHVLEHVENPDEVLRACRSALSPQGRLIVEVPNARSISARISPSTWLGWDPPNHHFHFGPQGLLRAAISAGLKPVRIQGGSLLYDFIFLLDAYNDRLLGKPQSLFSVLKQGTQRAHLGDWLSVLPALPLTLLLTLCTLVFERLARQPGSIRLIAKPEV
jgi:SAM-dependent methyltransferase